LENKSNFLNETLGAIVYDAGKSKDDVEWVGSVDGLFAVSWDEFKEIGDFAYDNRCGTVKPSLCVPLDLVVVFKDGTWLRRVISGGVEKWVYVCPPRKLECAESFEVIKNCKYHYNNFYIVSADGGYIG